MASVKEQILQGVAADEIAWNRLVAEVPPARMSEPGPMGDWTFRDLVSHLLAWRDRTISRLEAAGAGAPRPANPWPAGTDDDDPINDWFRRRDDGRTAADLLQAYAASFARLTAAVAALAPAAFVHESPASPGFYRWRDNAGELESDFSGHLNDHSDDVRAWLARG